MRKLSESDGGVKVYKQSDEQKVKSNDPVSRNIFNLEAQRPS